jgi:vitamin-K-epoxide reductase (warfarin-sensitive)
VQPAVNSTASTAVAVRVRSRVLLALIAILALGGIIVSAISLERHYAASSSGFCDFNQKFNCDIVNRSEYSTIAGIPVAGIGFAGYAVLFFLAAFRQTRRETPTQLFAAALAGLVFALYLTYIEAYKLETWCILCLSSLALIAAITLFSGIVTPRTRKIPNSIS